MNKPRILTFIDYYLPGFKSGGPVRSVSNLVARLGDELDFHIVTRDRDMTETEPYSGVTIDGWNTVGKARVYYASPGNRSLRSWVRLFRETPHDLVYLNSFFSPIYTIRPLLARRLRLIPERPTILAPRGEFSEGALALKSWKKNPYIAAAFKFGLYGELVWHASSDYEASDICRVMDPAKKRIRIAPVIAPDLPTCSELMPLLALHQERAPDEPLWVCFISRISPKKNLDYALRILAEVRAPVVFNIYGVLDDKQYWENCQEMIKRLPRHVTARYHGAIDHADVLRTLAQNDLFFFPTRGENFGHVIHEALASGLPVLISDQTPWRNLEEVGVGWDFPLLEADRFRAVIDAQANLDAASRQSQRHRARQYASGMASAENVISSNRALFSRFIAKDWD